MMIKRQGAKLILLLPGMISAFFIFIGVVSIDVGLKNSHEEGFIMPVLCGLLLVFLALALFYGSLRLLFEKTKEKDIINHI